VQINKSVLDNGLRVITARLPHLRTVSIAVAFGGGARYETRENAGISHLLEHLIFDNQDAVSAIEGMGGVANGIIFEEDVLIACRLPLRHFLRGMPYFFEMLFHPRFSEERLEHERGVLLEEYREIGGNPSELFVWFFAEKFFEGHPLGSHTLAAFMEALPRIDLPALKQFYRQLFVTGNVVVSAVGDIDHQEFVKKMWAWEVALPAGKPPSYPRGQVKSGIRVEGKPFPSEQAYLAFGCETVSLFHPDRFVLDVISSYLGKGSSSRLFTKLRSEAGLVYDVHTAHEVFLDTGHFSVQTVCDPGNAERVLDLSLLELAALCEGRIEERNLTTAKEQLAGSLEAELENPMGLALGLARQELFKGEFLTPDEVADRIRAVTLEEVVQVSNGVLDPDNFLLVVIGPIKDSKAS